MLLLTSALMVLVAADTCSDCTAVVNAVQARILFYNGVDDDDDDHCSAVVFCHKNSKRHIKMNSEQYTVISS